MNRAVRSINFLGSRSFGNRCRRLSGQVSNILISEQVCQYTQCQANIPLPIIQYLQLKRFICQLVVELPPPLYLWIAVLPRVSSIRSHLYILSNQAFATGRMHIRQLHIDVSISTFRQTLMQQVKENPLLIPPSYISLRAFPHLPRPYSPHSALSKSFCRPVIHGYYNTNK